MSGQVITLADVEMLRTQLGEPKEFLDDRGEGMSVPVDEPEAKTTKRLRRCGIRLVQRANLAASRD